MNIITINRDKCKKDGICIAECPFLLLQDSGDGIPVAIEGAGNICIHCGHCLAICPSGAISLNGIGADQCENIDPKLHSSAKQAQQLFKSRRSVRTYKDKPVDRTTLETLIDTARWAPSAKNVQPVNWIVIENRDRVHHLASMVIDWFRTNKVQPEIVQAFEAGHDIIHRGAPCLIVAHAASNGFRPAEDCTIAISAVETLAPAFGLGACWAGFFLGAAKKSPQILNYLSLPEGHEVYAALMIGHPKYHYARIPPRNDAKIDWRVR